MHHVLTVAATALRLYLRQPAAVIASFLVPVVVMAVFGVVFGSMGGPSDADPITLVVADEDRSEASARLITALESLESVEVDQTFRKSRSDTTEIPYDRAAAEAAIRRGDLGSALVIPKGYGASLGALDVANAELELELLSDTARPIENGIIGGMLQQAAFLAIGPEMASSGMTYLAEDLKIPRPLMLLMQGWMKQNADFLQLSTGADGEGGGSMVAIKEVDVLGEDLANPVFSQQMAGVLTIFLLFSVSAAAASLLRERDNGTLKRLLAAPVKPGHYLLGKYFAFTLLAYLQVLVMYVAGWLIFKVAIFDHLPALLLFGLLAAFAATSFGMLLAALCKTHEQVGAFSTMIILPMSAIGGSMMPREMMPETLQRAGYFTFNGWAMQGFTDILWRDAGLAGIALECAVLVGMAALLLGIATVLFNKRLLRV